MKNVFRRRHHITSPAAITQLMASWDRHHVISWRVHLREFAQYGERWLWARSIQPKFRPVRPGKVVHVKKWTSFFETFPVGPNRSIEFWTKISGNFGRMDRALCFQVSYFFRVWQNRGKHYILLWKRKVNLGHTGNISPFIQPSGVHLLSTSLFSFYKRTSTNPPCSHLSTTATSLY